MKLIEPFCEHSDFKGVVTGIGFEPLTFRVAVLTIDHRLTRCVINYSIPITLGEVTQVFQKR